MLFFITVINANDSILTFAYKVHIIKPPLINLHYTYYNFKIVVYRTGYGILEKYNNISVQMYTITKVTFPWQYFNVFIN